MTDAMTMDQAPFDVMDVPGGAHVKMWTRGVPVDDKARAQLAKAAALPFVFKHVAAMPDVHVGIGATVGSVIPTKGAVIPAAVGVDIGCGMMAARTSLHANDLPDKLDGVRDAIERAVPHGRSVGRGGRDKGSWGDPPIEVVDLWGKLSARFKQIAAKYPRLERANHVTHLGTLGTGNHFIELCLDTEGRVWVMLHSGSRGVGNAIGTFFIELAKQDMRKWFINLPDQDLAYFPEGTDHFDDYVEAVEWAQEFAALNRQMMMANMIRALRGVIAKPFDAEMEAINCHHNYVRRENHFGENVRRELPAGHGRR
jgi:tRNA-splicing ligase RtcB (3'-phosphate/5'-hydroxy nucleic acid ligase)